MYIKTHLSVITLVFTTRVCAAGVSVPATLASGEHRSDLWPEVTLVFVPLRALQRPSSILFLIEGVSHRGSHRDKH